MRITALVVNKFREVEHAGHIYEPGERYPADGFEATAERVSFLAQVHPSYNKIYLANVQQESPKTDEPPSPFPKHTGGGWYTLSNGEKVQGKDEAIAAQQALNSGDA